MSADKPYVELTSTELFDLFLIVQNSRNLSRSMEFGNLTLERIREEGLKYVGELETSDSSSTRNSPAPSRDDPSFLPGRLNKLSRLKMRMDGLFKALEERGE